MRRVGLPWIGCVLASLTAAVTLSAPGEAAAATPAHNGGGFFTNDGGALALVAGIAGSGTVALGSTIQRTGTIDSYAQRIDNIAQAGANGDAAAIGIQTEVRTAAVGARFLPILAGVGEIATPILAGATAFYIGWKIGRGLDDYYQRLRMKLAGLTAGAGVTSGKWVLVASTELCGPAGGCWYYTVSGGVGSDIDRWCDGPSTGCGGAYANASVKAAIQGAGGTIVNEAGSDGCSGNTTYSGSCHFAVMSYAEMEAATQVAAAEAVPQGAPAPSWWTSSPADGPIASTRTSSYGIPSNAGNPTDLAKARDVLDDTTPTSAERPATIWVNTTTSGGADPFGGGGGAPATIAVPGCLGQTAAACTSALRAAGFLGTITTYVVSPADADTSYPADGAIVELPAPGAQVQSTGVVTIDFNPGAADMPLALPQPGPNETYGDYIARLQALGWVGTVTYLDLDSTSSDPSTGPNGVVRVQAKPVGSTTLTTWPRAAWPLPLPKLARTTDITVTRNPPTSPPAPTPGPPPGGGGGGDVPAGGLDFSPLNLDVGCKFPFGFVCYAKDVTGWFNVAPVAPSFHFSLGSSTNLIGAHNYNVDLGDSRLGLNGYMAILRALESVAIWVGAVYLLATRLLGFHGGGDPGEAVDEAGSW